MSLIEPDQVAPKVAIDVEWMSVPRQGELVNGDGVLVRREADHVLVAVIDSLGHGPKAHEVTCRALEHLETISLAGGVLRAMESLHLSLRGTRGAAGLLLIATRDSVEVSSVGNVEMRTQRSSIPLVLSAGILGQRLRMARVATAKPARPERVIIFSDGISSRFDFRDVAGLPTKEASSRIFASCRRSHDDATVLVLDLQ